MRNLPEPDRADARATLAQALSQYRYREVLQGYAGTPAEIDEVMGLYDDFGPIGVREIVRAAGAQTVAGALMGRLYGEEDEAE